MSQHVEHRRWKSPAIRVGLRPGITMAEWWNGLADVRADHRDTGRPSPCEDMLISQLGMVERGRIVVSGERRLGQAHLDVGEAQLRRRGRRVGTGEDAGE